MNAQPQNPGDSLSGDQDRGAARPDATSSEANGAAELDPLLGMLNDAGLEEPPPAAEAKLRSELQQLESRLAAAPEQPPWIASLLSSWLRPRLQFSLRGMLVLMLLCCIPTFFVARPFLLQQIAAREVVRQGGQVDTAPGGPDWLPDYLGKGMLRDVVMLDVADCKSASDGMRHVMRCPKLQVLVVGGQDFTDDHLELLGNLKELRGLVLDSTSHTAAGLERLQATLPDLEVRQSWRQVEEALDGVATFDTGSLPVQRITVLTSFLTPYSPYGGPDWLRARTNNKYFKDLISVRLNSNASDEHLDWLAKLKDYQALHLRGSRITNEGMARLAELSSSQLALNYTEHPCLFDGDGLARLTRGRKTISNLMIHGVPLGESDLAFLDNQTQLEFLELAACGIRDEQVDALVPMRLQHLDLRANPISDAGLKKLRRLRSLRSLRLHETQVTQAGVDNFVYDMPYCRVSWAPTNSK